MLKNHLKIFILEHLKFEPVEGQIALVDALSEMMASPDNQSVMLIKGYAGTGKTSVISAFVRTLNDFKVSAMLMAPTGRAAKVLSTYSGNRAYTIHKKIYRQKSPKDDGFGDFTLNYNVCENTFFIIDEASMISHRNTEGNAFGSGNLLDDLIKFVYNGRNCRLILMGDTAQLPPVGQEQSRALDKHELEAYGLTVLEYELTEVIRQSKDSGILSNATMVRELITKNQSAYPLFNVNSFPDIKRITGGEFIEIISDAYDTCGIEETVVICRSNKQANRYNAGIRNQILYREEELTSGDYLMVVRNNYYWIKDSEDISFIANGDIVKIQRIIKYHHRYDFRFVEAVLSLPDYEDYEFTALILLDALNAESASITAEQSKKLFDSIVEDYAHITSKKARYEKIKEDRFFNALQVKFAYAVTCHKAQGGQWRCVFLDQGRSPEDIPDTEYLRWLYTAITRSTEKLYLVNFSDKYFE